MIHKNRIGQKAEVLWGRDCGPRSQALRRDAHVPHGCLGSRLLAKAPGKAASGGSGISVPATDGETCVGIDPAQLQPGQGDTTVCNLLRNVACSEKCHKLNMYFCTLKRKCTI